MTFNDDRRNEPAHAPQEFPQAWWTVLHATQGAPKGFQPSRPMNARCREVSAAEAVSTFGRDSR